MILDDLDRIDPEHIFRILNILSAYFEKENNNKFGFDTIILVADYTNLKHIFHHKFGREADFSGYIDKYFSISPYYFDNKKSVLDTVEGILDTIKNGEPRLGDALGRSGFIRLFLNYIFVKTIDHELINLRELLKLTKYTLLELKKGSYNDGYFTDQFQQVLDKSIKIAINCFSSTDTFIRIISAIKNNQTKTNFRMPFDKFNLHIIHYLAIVDPNNTDITQPWKGYTLKINGVTLTVNEGGNFFQEKLFLDLLVEYIKSKKFLMNLQS